MGHRHELLFVILLDSLVLVQFGSPGGLGGAFVQFSVLHRLEPWVVDEVGDAAHGEEALSRPVPVADEVV